MEFLDPEYKRRHNWILVIGQGLVGLAVVTVALMLVLKAYGFDVDRKTGEVIQNGLVYVDSAPDKANIKINGQDHPDKTNTRFTLLAGGYDLQLNKEGYRTWQRKFELEGSEIERFNYPMLVPKDLKTVKVDSNTTMKSVYSQSPDRNWLIVSENADLSSMKEYHLTDLTSAKLPKIRSFAIPDGVFEKAVGPSQFEVVDWSNNNTDFLVKHTYDNKFEYALLNRDQPTKSFNLKTIGTIDGEVSLLDKSADKFLVFNKSSGALTLINKKDKKTSLLLSGVLSFKSHGDDKILFTHVSPSDKTKARVSLIDNNKLYDIRDIPLSENLPLNIASFQDKWYIIIGSEKEGKTYIYEDFVKKSKATTSAKVSPIRVIKNNISSNLKLEFSKNVRFISSFGGGDISIYDMEDKKSYHYKIDAIMPAGDAPIWLDGHRIVVSGNGQGMMIDFDGSNKQVLTPLPSSKNIYFDRDYEKYYTIGSLDAVTYTLDQVALRTPADQ
ncbi:hypothetical protein A3F37_02795 [Candidatus Saccharibacteria bacterium RIFCSPHIGHO2_12_FULL_41_12]|nr:MAG: hypothetical protein A3F37_02795 [Candidatus Saccharibacteria bacterium RIFCSPHIGHO2_12_FULL_41_12]